MFLALTTLAFDVSAKTETKDPSVTACYTRVIKELKTK